MVPQIHPSLLLLAQSVVVFIDRRVEGGDHPVALCARVCRRHFRALRLHHPRAHVQQHLAVGSCHHQRVVVRTTPAVVRTIPAAASSEVVFAQLEIQRVERHRSRQLVLGQIRRRQAHHHPGGPIHIVAFRVALMRPSLR